MKTIRELALNPPPPMTSQMLCDSPCSRGTLLRAFARVAFPALCLTGALLVGGAQAQTSVTTDPVGYISTVLNPGPTFIGAGLHRTADYRGTVASVGTNSLVVSGTDPGWTTSPTLQFGPRDNFTQYVVVVVKDVNATASSNVEGDWWPVVSNGSNQLTVDTTHPFTVAAGDQIEVRHLTTIQDLFGLKDASGNFIAGSTLNPDADGSPNQTDEDIVRFVQGTNYIGNRVYYHDDSISPVGLSNGFYVGGSGPYDGSTITIGPDQPIVLFRKAGSAPLTVTNLGAVQTTHLTHYLIPGPNAVVTGFAADAPIGTSGLTPPASGWLSDNDGSPTQAQEDIIRATSGTSFTDRVYYHDSGGAVLPTGWYVNGSSTPNNAYALKMGTCYIYFLKTDAGSLVWRQNAPY